MNVGCTSPWALVLDGVKGEERKPAEHQHPPLFSYCLAVDTYCAFVSTAGAAVTVLPFPR